MNNSEKERRQEKGRIRSKEDKQIKEKKSKKERRKERKTGLKDAGTAEGKLTD